MAVSRETHRRAGILVDHEGREENDFYATVDPRAVDELLARESFTGAAWECACGEGHMSKDLIRWGMPVISTDLIDRGYGETGVDFLKATVGRAPNIITNPPFKLATEFCEKALELTTGKVAMFMKVLYLAGQGRKERLWDKLPLKTVYVFSYRVKCLKNAKPVEGGGVLDFAWYVFEHGYTGDPIIKFI